VAVVSSQLSVRKRLPTRSCLCGSVGLCESSSSPLVYFAVENRGPDACGETGGECARVMVFWLTPNMI